MIEYITMSMRGQQVNDVQWYCNFLKQANLRITVEEFNRLPLDSMSTASRAAAYAILSYNQGRFSQSLSFFRLAKEYGTDDEELAHLLHLEGMVLFAIGDPKSAIGRQQECVKLCNNVKDKQLVVATLSRLSLMYEAIGDRESAEKYEKRAARFLLRKDYPKGFPS